MFKEFRDFISRGNVVDLAVAVVIGAAFGRIITTLVDGVIMPPLGLLLGRVDFASLFVLLDRTRGMPASLAEAKAQGIPVIAYGQLLNDVLTFLIVAASVFILIRQTNRFKRPAEAPPASKECPFCASTIPARASRCPHCTSPV
jgi:large conductance mechanosensitive channel